MSKMKKLYLLIPLICLGACKANPTEQYPKSDLAKNTEASKNTIEENRNKTEINNLNHYGKPEAK